MKTCFARVRARVDAIDGIWALNLPFFSLEQTKTEWQRKAVMMNIKETVLQIPWEQV